MICDLKRTLNLDMERNLKVGSDIISDMHEVGFLILKEIFGQGKLQVSIMSVLLCNIYRV